MSLTGLGKGSEYCCQATGIGFRGHPVLVLQAKTSSLALMIRFAAIASNRFRYYSTDPFPLKGIFALCKIAGNPFNHSMRPFLTKYNLYLAAGNDKIAIREKLVGCVQVVTKRDQTVYIIVKAEYWYNQ